MPQSQDGQVGFITQPTVDVYKDPGAAIPNDGIFMRLRSGSMNANRELLIPDPEIGGNRDVPDAVLGSASYSGEFEFYPRMESITTLLAAALGEVASVTNAGTVERDDANVTHTITPVDGAALPWLSVEEGLASSYESFGYTNVKVNTFHLESDADGYLTGSVGLVATTQLAGITRTVAPSWDITPLMVGSQVVITVDGNSYSLRSFSIDISNNLEDDVFVLGSITLSGIEEKRREITMGMSLRPTDSTLWRQAVYGTEVATGPIAGAATKEAVAITITSFENIYNTAVPYTMVINIPQAILKPFENSASGDDVIENDIEIQAVRPAAGVDIMNVAITNGLLTVR